MVNWPNKIIVSLIAPYKKTDDDEAEEKKIGFQSMQQLLGKKYCCKWLLNFSFALDGVRITHTFLFFTFLFFSAIISNISSTTCKWKILKQHFEWNSNAFVRFEMYSCFLSFSFFFLFLVAFLLLQWMLAAFWKWREICICISDRKNKQNPRAFFDVWCGSSLKAPAHRFEMKESNRRSAPLSLNPLVYSIFAYTSLLSA